jgi:chromosome segregation ATPase
MSIEERLTALENEMARMREDQQLPKLAKAIKEMEDAMAVVARQHARLAANHKSAVEWLESHNQAMMEIREAQRAADARIEKLSSATDARIEKLVSAIGDLLRTRGPRDNRPAQ